MPADQPDESMPRFTVATARVLAEVAHDRQKDKLKRPYREHVLAVGDALADFDDDIQIAGYLHDIAEDTPMTRQALLEMGVSERAVETIERLTNRLHENPDDYAAIIREIADDRDATLVKIADNAHNSLPERVKALAAKWPGKPPVTKYRDARPVLYAAVPAEDVRMILERINPWLLPVLDKLSAVDDGDDDNNYADAGAAADGANAADTGRDATSSHADDDNTADSAADDVADADSDADAVSGS
ncbi:GTP pyrophosphokinase [Arthrobacter ulcerisalmonis]|uniref:GTP pyrophosphokinase n=1 Tax=Arthrobacter ulcerisalmonis TaxID=2483813 RepID=A0A3P5WPI5_9MICC|nr:HD domain-containing protein [Arthrobacter ulcerisalmonis]VDC21441.1 GTP pyrophosphokinase [Arthrobacter ulcerisalmonis]